MRRPFWSKEELGALREAEKKDEAWYRHGCGCLGYGCPPLAATSSLPLVLLLD